MLSLFVMMLFCSYSLFRKIVILYGNQPFLFHIFFVIIVATNNTSKAFSITYNIGTLTKKRIQN